MKKIFYFELDENVVVRNSEEEILEAYFKNLPAEAIADVPIVSAYAVEINFPAEQCSTNYALLGNISWSTYWVERGYKGYSVNKFIENGLPDADIVCELHNVEEFQVNISLQPW